MIIKLLVKFKFLDFFRRRIMSTGEKPGPLAEGCTKEAGEGAGFITSKSNLSRDCYPLRLFASSPFPPISQTGGRRDSLWAGEQTSSSKQVLEKPDSRATG